MEQHGHTEETMTVHCMKFTVGVLCDGMFTWNSVAMNLDNM